MQLKKGKWDLSKKKREIEKRESLPLFIIWEFGSLERGGISSFPSLLFFLFLSRFRTDQL